MWLATMVAAVIAFAVWWSCADMTLHWESDDGSLRVRVSATSQDFIGRCKSRLEVTHAGQVVETQMDDDAHLGRVCIVEYRGWILVISDDLVLGGYDRQNRRIVGDNCWRALPFTVWRGGGVVLAEAVFTRRGLTPAGFPLVPEAPE